jgi:hypothetical protein
MAENGETPAGLAGLSAPRTTFYDARCVNSGIPMLMAPAPSIGGDPGLLDDFGP